LDVRVSIVPITNGEKIVLRLLSEKSRSFGLSDLGLGEQDLTKVETAFKKPYGMLLSTGPTGCGKTTTMYAVLKLLNKRDVNIMTIEDPVEYEIGGVNQIQVNTKTNLTFAKGLRSIVRQDPNIILVGEVRDAETAGIAVNSAMTGHLVLSTLHTNDAATAIPRLLDMGVEPFLVASSVNVIIAQRLVRTICMKCRVSEEVSKKAIATLLQVPEDMISSVYKEDSCRTYKGKGCPVCHDTGYVGRVGLFEVMEITDPIREAITGKKDAAVIKDIAVKEGMSTMMMEGIKKVKEGVTTLEEVIRVVRE
jgi:type II secretory ATPase GspE/PulE/Tfp pilus assembly ATPase PilB-like protein